jgi:murein DD-endopeptidase MepM/ murein hydrolase activator NlpD
LPEVRLPADSVWTSLDGRIRRKAYNENLKRSFLLPALLLLPLRAQHFEIPSSVKQGDALRVAVRDAGGRGASVRLGEKTVPLFPQKSGERMALVPVPVNFAPGPHKVAILDARAAVLHETSVDVQDAHFPRQNIRATPGMQALKPLPGEMEAMRGLQNTVTPERFWADELASPVPGCMSSPFGVARYHNNKPTGNYHRGVDIRAPEGRPVHAPAAGTVKIARLFRLHGGTIGLDHGQGVTSSYIHLSKLAVREGVSVKQGDLIGYIGSTGFATGPHLHWGLYVHGLPVNAKQWNPASDWLAPCKPH